LREWYGFAIGAAFSGVVAWASIQLWEIVFGVVLRPMAAILGLQQRLHQNLELPTWWSMYYFVEIALPIAKWELTFVVMLKRENIVRSSCRLWYLCGCLS
jgi:hypothetical protein